MSLPDPLLLANDSNSPAAKIYSPQPNQQKYRREYAGGNYIVITTTQQQTKTRKRHLIRLDSYSAPDVNQNVQSASFNLTVDEPISSTVFTDSFMTDTWTMFKSTITNDVWAKLLNGEL